MKKNGHPNYQEVLFVDSSTGVKFVCGTTLQTKDREKYNGKEYPVCHLPISSSSHPFFVGSSSIVDTEGRVDRFKNKYAAANKKAEAKPAVEPVKEKKKKK